MRYGLGCMLEQQRDPTASHAMGPSTFGHIGLGGPISYAMAVLTGELTEQFATNEVSGGSLEQTWATALAPLAGSWVS